MPSLLTLRFKSKLCQDVGIKPMGLICKMCDAAVIDEMPYVPRLGELAKLPPTLLIIPLPQLHG